MTFKLMSTLMKHELKDFVKQPPLLMLVILPLLMSVMVIGFMNEEDLARFLVPSWILFAQVMVGLMIIAPGIVEEKEQKTLDALLISPLSLQKILFVKVLMILIFSVMSQLLVYLLNLGYSNDIFLVLPFMIVGGILFIQVGLVTGLLMKSSKTSAAFSSIVMVVLFVTASFYQQLPEWYQVLQLIPSIVVVENIHGALNEQLLLKELLLLLFWLIGLSGLVYILIKKETNK
ncbi:MAG: ABC transporter permease [Bacillaceae bacterium]|nr:ABC transporter permease [Bacillaceae bacterium]